MLELGRKIKKKLSSHSLTSRSKSRSRSRSKTRETKEKSPIASLLPSSPPDFPRSPPQVRGRGGVTEQRKRSSSIMRTPELLRIARERMENALEYLPRSRSGSHASTTPSSNRHPYNTPASHYDPNSIWQATTQATLIDTHPSSPIIPFDFPPRPSTPPQPPPTSYAEGRLNEYERTDSYDIVRRDRKTAGAEAPFHYPEGPRRRGGGGYFKGKHGGEYVPHRTPDEDREQDTKFAEQQRRGSENNPPAMQDNHQNHGFGRQKGGGRSILGGGKRQ